jgi:protein gp37
VGAKTSISWTEKTWNYFRGCSETSPGCANCYARLMAARMSGHNPDGSPQPYNGLAYFDENGKSHWTGKVVAVPDHLDDPMRWQKPSLIFVNSMSDWCHETVEYNAVVNMFEVMEKASWHIFQPLTKRAELMPDMLRSITLKSGRNLGKDPLPNVWMGVTMENEKTAASRSKYMAEVAKMGYLVWWSAEPLVGNCDWERWVSESRSKWVVFGGESRQGDSDTVRDMPLSWVYDGLAACKKLGVSAHVKQLGYWWAKNNLREEKCKADPHGKKMECWPLDLRIQDYPVDIVQALKWDGKSRRVGKTIPLEVVNTVTALQAA